MKFVDRDLMAVQEARVLMEEAGEAKTVLGGWKQENLDRVVHAMMKACSERVEMLVQMAVRETGYGEITAQVRICRFLIASLEKSFENMRCVGILESCEGEGVLEIGVPLGVIAVAVPALSPVSAVLFGAVSAVKAGNAVVFAPHPRAVETTKKTVQILREVALAEGLPDGAISCMETSAKDGALELFGHPQTSLILNMGEEALYRESPAGKTVIYGGIVPSPVFIERSADVRQAVADIVAGRSFNCGIVAGSEQYVVADSRIAEIAKQEMISCGAYFMDEKEEKKLICLLGIGEKQGCAEKEYIGKSAEWLATKAGFSVPKGTRVLVSEQTYITDFNPYANALLCPVIVFYIESDWTHACEKCMELLMGENHGNTLAIHSTDAEIIRQFALKKPVGRVLVNTPSSVGAMGVTTNLFPSAVLGSLSAGMGITAENVSPMNLIYRRKAAFGVRSFQKMME